LKTLNLLFNEYGADKISADDIRQKYFGERNKSKFEKMLSDNPKLLVLQSSSKRKLSLFGLSTLIENRRNRKHNTEVNNMVTTRLGLLEQFGSCIIHLTDVAEQFLPFSYDITVKKIKSGELALNVFKIMDSQKAPLLVHIDDLVELLDARRKKAKEELIGKAIAYENSKLN